MVQPDLAHVVYSVLHHTAWPTTSASQSTFRRQFASKVSVPGVSMWVSLCSPRPGFHTQRCLGSSSTSHLFTVFSSAHRLAQTMSGLSIGSASHRMASLGTWTWRLRCMSASAALCVLEISMSVPRMCSEARRVVGVQVGRAQC